MNVGAPRLWLAAAIIGLAATAGISGNGPSALTPWPFHGFLLMLWMFSWDWPYPLILLCVGLLAALVSVVWLRWQLSRKRYGITVPLLLALLAVFIAQVCWLWEPTWWFSPNLSYYGFALVPGVLAIYGITLRRSNDADVALVWHALVLGWIGWGFLPYLGELP